MSADDFGGFEPAAEHRELAATVWGTYVALRKEGFTEAQALAIVGQLIMKPT